MENDRPDIILLPLWSVYRDEGASSRLAVRVIRSESVHCDLLHPDERCDQSGIHYSPWSSVDGPDARMLCARHWHAMHAGASPKYSLEDMTDEEYQDELLAFMCHRRSEVREAIDRIHVIANRLAQLGFQREADRIYQTTGAIDVIARQSPRV